MTLPLFPLNLVLFPGSRIRLHIFEPRYKAMIGNCLERSSPFGIVFVQNDTLMTIGCTATVDEITKRYADGTFDIDATGGQRFEILASTHSAENLLIAEVQEVADIDDLPDPKHIREAIELYNTLVGLAYGNKVAPIESPDDVRDVGMLSYQLAEKAGLEMKSRQELLEILSEKERLNKITRHIQHTLPVIEDRNRLRAVVMNDGYLPHVRG